MRSPTDPILRARRRSAATIGVGGGAVLITALWTWWPLSSPVPDLSADLAAPLATVESDAPGLRIDRAAFAARLWNPVPTVQALPTAPPAAPSAPPLRAQLLGIIHDGGTLLAAFYDPDEDAIRRLAVGDSLAGHRIDLIDAEQVILSRDRHRRILRLREDRP